MKNPDLLVMNEPTSGLDPSTEQKVMRAVLEWATGRTVLWALGGPSLLPGSTGCWCSTRGRWWRMAPTRRSAGAEARAQLGGLRVTLRGPALSWGGTGECATQIRPIPNFGRALRPIPLKRYRGSVQVRGSRHPRRVVPSARLRWERRRHLPHPSGDLFAARPCRAVP